MVRIMAGLYRKSVMLAVVMLVVFVVVSSVESTKDGSQELRKKAEEGKEEAESWREWAKEKISEGLGLKPDEPSVTSDAAARAAKSTKDKVQDFTSGNCFLFHFLFFFSF